MEQNKQRMQLRGKSLRHRTPTALLLKTAGYKRIFNGWARRFDPTHRYHAIKQPSGKLQIHTDADKQSGRGHWASTWLVRDEIKRIAHLDFKLTPPPPPKFVTRKTVEMTPEIKSLIKNVGERNSNLTTH